MSKSARNLLSFTVMTLVVFSGMTLLVWGGILAGPRPCFQMGLTGWLTFYRYNDGWSFDHIEPVPMLVDLGLAIFLTLLLGLAFGVVKRIRRKLDESADH